MNNDPRTERQLASLLEDLYLGPSPDYRNDVLARVARSRQRPAWTFPGRWLPMVEFASQPLAVRRVPWRLIAVVTLIALLIAASAAAYIGSRPRLPAPFGPAANGLVAYAQGNSILLADPVSGTSKPIFSASTPVYDPAFSQDGTRVLFEEGVPSDSNASRLFVVQADGGGLKELTANPVLHLAYWGFSPDGQSVVIISTIGISPSISILAADGSGMRTLKTPGLRPGFATSRPGGSEIMFIGTNPSELSGIYLIAADGTGLRTVVAPSFGHAFLDGPTWSPDGSQISYNRYEGSMTVRLHVASYDGTADRIVGHDPAAWIEGGGTWSPDGKRMLIERLEGAVGDYKTGIPTVITIDGSAPDVVIHDVWAYGGTDTAWSPDGRFIQARPKDDTGNGLPQVIWDAATGTRLAAPWTATSYPTWQRLAP